MREIKITALDAKIFYILLLALSQTYKSVSESKSVSCARGGRSIGINHEREVNVTGNRLDSRVTHCLTEPL